MGCIRYGDWRWQMKALRSTTKKSHSILNIAKIAYNFKIMNIINTRTCWERYRTVNKKMLRNESNNLIDKLQ